MPSDYSGFDWYLKLYAWAARIGIAAIIAVPIALILWALS